MTSMPGSLRTASICATRARETSAPVASPPACTIRSAWWPPSRVSEMEPSGAAVEHGAPRDQLADARRALGDQHLDRARVAQAGARDQGVLQVRGRRVRRVERRRDAALRPDRRTRRQRVLGDEQDPRHPGAQLERGGQAGDPRADDDGVRLHGPARRGRREPGGQGGAGPGPTVADERPSTRPPSTRARGPRERQPAGLEVRPARRGPAPGRRRARRSGSARRRAPRAARTSAPPRRRAAPYAMRITTSPGWTRWAAAPLTQTWPQPGSPAIA